MIILIRCIQLFVFLNPWNKIVYQKFPEKQIADFQQFLKKIQTIEMKSSSDQISNFSRILKNLQIDNVSIPELRLLKQEHSYLEKLRIQRSKIEELKVKFNQTESQLMLVLEQNHNIKSIVQDQSRTIQMMQNKIHEEQNKRMLLENGVNRQFQVERQKNRNRILELATQNEDLKKIIKQKEMTIFSLEDQHNEKLQRVKQSISNEKRKIIHQYQQKLRRQTNQKNQGEITQIRALITRQNKALKMQSEQHEELLEKYNQLTQQHQKIQNQFQQKTTQNQMLANRCTQMAQYIEEINIKLQQYDQDTFNRTQLEEIRKKMNELTQGQIQKIEVIVNQFE